MSLPSQPLLTPTSASPEMSPLVLPPSPASPVFSEISLEDLSLGESDSDSAETGSSAGTDDSCTSDCCVPDFPLNGSKSSSSSSSSHGDQVIATVAEMDWSPLIIIGSGPHALALATRLNEPRPAALYTDLEHARLSWLQRDAAHATGRRQAVKGHWPARKLVTPRVATLAQPRNEADEDLAAEPRPSIQVLDSSGSLWLSRWDAFFAGLSITHLRSPMTFHPSPADADALVGYAQRTSREDELEPIKGVVGSEFSKYQRKKRRATVAVGGSNLINERDRQDYQRPSTPLFRDFLQDELVDRYPVPQVTHTSVTSVNYGLVHVQGEGPRLGFVVDSIRPDGTPERRAAQAVAMAVGPSSVPTVPTWLHNVSARRSADSEEHLDPWRKEAICGSGWCHSSAFAVQGCRPTDGPLGDRVRRGEGTRVCVVGGGLTSAQIVDSLLKQGVTSVVLLVRSRIKTKHFDFDLEWVSKYNNLRKMEFFQESDPYARFEQIRSSRNGGSVNPTFARVLKQHEKSGRLEIRTMTEVGAAAYDVESGKWTLDTMTRPDPPSRRNEFATGRLEPTRARISNIDFIVASTGSKLDFASVDFVQPLVRAGLVPETVHGLPVLTQDLQLSSTVPFFVLGAYAMLERIQLGPDALNLSGTRAGAERVAHRLGELGIFGQYSIAAQAPSARLRTKQARSGGEGNFFDGLGEVEA
ncbi:hypothetical protein JCM10908_004095 [Rhodotorula pacifica]|uniref:uncharacterized protein n=1 Tax=Rhodotorula pacifica TaxID=1495444 RepID=UPI0031804D5A